MNVVLVTRNSIFGRYLAAGLHQAGRIDRLIVETGGPGWRYYWRKLRRSGPLDAAFQLWLNRRFRRRGRRWLPNLPMPAHISVRTVNEYPFEPDDLAIGFGTSIVRRTTLESLANGFLNLHTGWLPEYRGVKSEFWALLRADSARTGWTLHFMTERLDAGDIVLRGVVPAWPDDPVALRARLIQDAVPAIAELIDMVRAMGPESIPRFPQGEGEGTYYTTPGLRHWRRYRRMRAGA